ncbi:hypothetical protein ACFYSJ_27500 [Streptomyces sp. NPDC005248]|uniref:hypothetical protein n=1 Tax=unclassified Streptomyces TaxID=2593676 RepID=UPI0033BCE641
MGITAAPESPRGVHSCSNLTIAMAWALMADSDSSGRSRTFAMSPRHRPGGHQVLPDRLRVALLVDEIVEPERRTEVLATVDLLAGESGAVFSAG